MKSVPMRTVQLGVVFAVVLLVLIPKWTVDDAFITFRYATNLAQHGQLTWNVGQPPIEGYTGIGLPVLLASLLKLGIDPQLGSKAIGIVAFLLGMLLFWRLLSVFSIQEPLRSIVLVLFILAPFAFVHAVSGLETTLFGAAIMVSLLASTSAARCAERCAGKEVLLLVSLLFVSFVRPEGIVLGLVVIVALGFLRFRTGRRVPFAFGGRAALVFLAPYTGYFLWRWQYYGQLLPNTFYAKSYTGLVNPTSTSALWDYVLQYIAIPLLACLVLIIANPTGLWSSLKVRAKSLAGEPLAVTYCAYLIFVAIVVAQYLRSSLVMNYQHRFFAPFFPIALIGIAFLATRAVQSLVRWRSAKKLVFSALLVFVVVLSVAQAYSYFRGYRSGIAFASQYGQLIADEHIPAGLFLKENVPPSEWLTVYVDAGAIPYFSGLRSVDFGELNDTLLSHKELTKSELVDYFYSYNPGAAVFTSFDWNKVDYRPGSAAITSDPRFKDYILVKKYRSEGRRNYFELVYLRKDLVHDGLTPSEGGADSVIVNAGHDFGWTQTRG